MRIPDSAIQEVLSSADIVSLIGEHVQLKKAGNSYKGLCPFHTEKTPSFNVNPGKNFFHCFGCGAGGNAISFVMKYHNLDFVESVKFLAEKFGVGIEFESSEQYEGAKDVEALHEDILKLTRRALISKEGAEALQYLKKRELDDETIEDFQLGYIPPKVDVKPFQVKYGRKILMESGLFSEGKYGPRLRFYNRLMFPIKSVTGKTIAFSGRSLDGSNPKYVNSPETALFKKRSILYNLDNAKESIRKEDMCVIVEGYMDVIRLHSFGFRNAVATMGTALTPEHVNILKRYTGESVLLFDGDEAGFNSAVKSLDVFLAAGYFPQVVFMPQGEDPDSFLLKHGADSLREMIDTREDLFILTMRMQLRRADSFNRKMNALNEVKKKLENIHDHMRRSYYIDAAAKEFQVLPEELRQEVSLRRGKEIAVNTARKRDTRDFMNYICERDFLSSLFEVPEDIAVRLVEGLQPEFFRSEKIRNIFKKIVEVFDKGDSLDVLRSNPVTAEELSIIFAETGEVNDHYETAYQNRKTIINNATPKVLNSKIQSAASDDEKLELMKKKFQYAKSRQNAGGSEV